MNEDTLKVYSNLQDLGPRKNYSKELSPHLKKHYPNMTEITIDFLERLLHLNPSKRMSCEEALRHPFFS